MDRIAVFCDFDGTITESDNIISIMKHFAPPEWESLKDKVLAEEISIQDGVGQMFALLPSSLKEEITSYVLSQANIRNGFEEFIAYLKTEKIPLYIVSGGIDFFIHPLLEQFGPFEAIYCNHSDFSGEMIKVNWPHECDEECDNGCGCCKPSIMRSRDEEGLYKIVIGDSITDLQAAKQADFVLARDLLLQKSRELGLDHRPFTDFFDCITELKRLIGVKL